MINKAILLGRVGQKEFKPTKNGSFICKLSIATNKNYIDSNGVKNQVTTWHNVNFFGKLAEICNQHLHVGYLVYIEGEITNRKYEENGVNKVSHSITGTEVKFIPNGRKGEPANPEITHEENHEAPELWGKEHEKSIDWTDADVPF